MGKALAVIAESFGIDVINAESLAKQFEEFQIIASEWDSKAKAIIVTDESQKDLMKTAGDGRKFLKKVRKNVEDTRVLLKNKSLREGQAIDGISNALKGMINPIMEHLDKQEKYVQIKESKRKQKLYDERVIILSPLGVVTSLYDLRNLPDKDFNDIVSSAKETIRLQKVEAERVESERVAKAEFDRQERENIRIENERLKAEAVIREKELAAEKEKSEALARLDATREAEKQTKIDEAKRDEETQNHNNVTITPEDMVIIARKAITNINQSTTENCEDCLSIRGQSAKAIKQLGGWLE